MSRHSSNERSVTIADTPEVLAVIREEQATPNTSSVNINDENKPTENDGGCIDCTCKEATSPGITFNPAEIENMLKEKEDNLRSLFAKQLDTEMSNLKERFDFILQNEQVRTGRMLQEAHRERQEKIQALQTQLECKNLAGLMYVMCTERRKSKLEKRRIIEEYSTYIRTLQEILADGQNLILNLSRGYKTAARVDNEWKNKMKKIIGEFQRYVYNFSGGTPESNQYVFDLPALLKTEAAVIDNPNEDPCNCEEEEEAEIPELNDKKTWWEQLEGDCRPFLMFGDMSEFQPPQRREVLKVVKGAKVAPVKWKNYVFNDMFVKSECPNTETIKDEYPKRLPRADQWECHAVQTSVTGDGSSNEYDFSRRVTTDMRGAMGSILKIVTASSGMLESKNKSNPNILAARDSMEIASTTKLRDRQRESHDNGKIGKLVSINLGSKSAIVQEDEEELEDDDLDLLPTARDPPSAVQDDSDARSGLGSIHQDSLVIGHVPEADHTINYEKICPMEQCQRLQVGSFLRSLPAYMRASPFTHFEQTYENYEACSPEQIAILRERLEAKKMRDGRVEIDEDPLNEWTASVPGVAVQTSALSIDLPPCTCQVPCPTPVSSTGRVFDMADLIPLKEALDDINKECFYDSRIQFNRFKVIGQKSDDSMLDENETQDFKTARLHEIKMILKKHPSLLELFQANTQC